jgi:hypothetical protein
MSRTHGLYPIVKRKAKFMMNQTYVDHKVYEWEGYYVYSSIVRGFLHLQAGIISLPEKLMDLRCPPHTLQISSECLTVVWKHRKWGGVAPSSPCLKTSDCRLAPPFPQDKSTDLILCMRNGAAGRATVNQHPPVHHEGWMVSGQETCFCWVGFQSHS